MNDAGERTVRYFMMFLAIPIFISLLLLNVYNQYVNKGTGELVLISEISGDDLTPLVEGTKAYVDISNDELGKVVYRFNHVDEKGKAKEVLSDQYNTSYFEVLDAEAYIKVEREIMKRPSESNKYRNMKYTIVMPK